MKKIILASNNIGKIKEIGKILQPLNYEILPQSFFNLSSIEETGITFVENALLKARHASQISQLPAIADDSGLIVTALNGEPGLYSSRYAGSSATDQENINKLLQVMAGVENREAYFYCVIVFIRHFADPTPIICEGYCRGTILQQPCGNNGFGYDPIFYLAEHHCSVAELPSSIKNTISHRAQALACLSARLLF